VRSSLPCRPAGGATRRGGGTAAAAVAPGNACWTTKYFLYTALFHHKMAAKTEWKQDLTKLN